MTLGLIMRRSLSWMAWKFALWLAMNLGRATVRFGPPLVRAGLAGSVAAWSAMRSRPDRIGPPRGERPRYCGQCGQRTVVGVEFCAGCGLLASGDGALAPAILRPCPACARPSDPSNYFCTACGVAWSRQARSWQPRPVTVEVAATLHTLAGVSVFILTSPFSLLALLALAGNPLAASWLGGAGLTVAVAAGVSGITWLAFSLATAWGLRRAQSWARTATLTIALLWSLTGVGALVGVPLIIGLILPGANVYFGSSYRPSAGSGHRRTDLARFGDGPIALGPRSS